MSKQSWRENLWASQADGPSLSNTTTETTLLNSQDKFTLPTGFWDSVGKVVKVSGMGRLSNLVTTPGTLTFKLYHGATAVWTGGAMQLSTTAHTTLPFWFELFLTSRAIGASANVIGVMKVFGQPLNVSGADPTTSHSFVMTPNVTPVVGTNFDSSVTQQVDFKATFSIANAANLIQLHQFFFEAVN